MQLDNRYLKEKLLNMTEARANFGSKIGIILATAGSAVGLGNVWRFPYMTGQNGGAAFIVLYLCCVLLLGIPCMISEFIIGRHGASNTARAYAKLSNGTPWKFIGLLGVITGFLITGYYAVVSGWCLQYIYASILGELHGNTAYVQQYFSDFSENPIKPIFWTITIMLITHFVIIHGVRGGIEKASKLLMPLLFILLIIVAVCSCLTPDAGKGIEFLFKPDFSKMNSDTFLSALGQSFYSLSIAMGCICTYASYYSRQSSLLNSALLVSLIATRRTILDVLMIFPAVVYQALNPGCGPSLIFITLPNVFNQAFANIPVIGWIVSLMFYALLALAALTSLISLHEVSTAFFYEELHITRKSGALLVTISCTIIGALCSLSEGCLDYIKVGGLNIFNLFDFVTGQIFPPIGGFFTCIFIGWYVPKKIVKDEFTNWSTIRGTFFSTYYFAVRFICPLCILAIFLHQLGIF